MDSLHYYYFSGTNLLKYVNDSVGTSAYSDDFEGYNGVTNYGYDAIGNLTADIRDSITCIKWNMQGKITEIHRTPGCSKPALEFRYDPMGNRVLKIVKPDTIQIHWVYTYYRRDAQGNILSTYEALYDAEVGWKLYQKEVFMYGSSRLGGVNVNRLIGTDVTAPVTSDANFISTYFINNSTEIDDCSLLLNSLSNYEYESFPVFSSGTGTDIYNETGNNAYLLEKVKRRHFTMQNRLLGKKGYELTNHLGNVLAVISDRKIQVQNTSNTSLVDYFLPDVISMTDYYAFGSMMPGRNLNSNNYPFGFNSQEKDNEIYGEGNAYTAMFWEYDPRLGRRWNVDPIMKFWESPYSCFANNPIHLIDLCGADTSCKTNEARSELKSALKNGNTNSDFSKLVNEWINNKNIKVNFTTNRKDLESFTDIKETDEGTIGYDGKEYWIFFNSDTKTKEQLGASPLYEEVFHLSEAIEGKEIKFAQSTSGNWGTSGLDIFDEVRAKSWVIKNAPIKSYYDYKDKNGVIYNAFTHYGYIKESKLDEDGIVKYLTEVTETTIYQKPSYFTGSTLNSGEMNWTITPGNFYKKLAKEHRYPDN